MPETLEGWLLDLYPSPVGQGVVMWVIGEDGERYHLTQPFTTVFYAAGPRRQLETLGAFVVSRSSHVRFRFTQRRDIFEEKPVEVLEIEIAAPVVHERLFRQAARRFPGLVYYDADVRLSLRHAAIFGSFPLCRCRFDIEGERLVGLEPLETPWDLDPEPVPLRILSLSPDSDPRQRPPASLILRFERGEWQFPLDPIRPALVNLRAVLRRCDPDILLTDWGDRWVLPELLRLAEESGIPLPLNRDPAMGVAHRPEYSYFSYGRVIHRDPQALLFGRAHIDTYNAMLFHDYGLDGVYEQARVTALPLQVAARVSPGTGISAMQMITALRQGILIPWHKQQAERPKTALQLMQVDQGGMVYQPLTGVHRKVAEIDFISMYPSIMVHCNISPETVVSARALERRMEVLDGMGKEAGEEGGLELPVEDDEEGLIPLTLAPLLEKRVQLKTRLARMPHWNPRRKVYKAQASAHKWLLVTCFGYLGYKNARFGRIEAHEAVTAYGREALLRAKEAAEEMGFTVLHMYVDGLWVQKPGAETVEAIQPLLEEITTRTGLPIALEGIYNWVAFLPSRADQRIPVPNRYFGVFQDGSLKLRGIAVRRRDTPRWVGEVQLELLAMLARVEEPGELPALLPAAAAHLRRRLADLREGRVPLEDLIATQKLSRTVAEYRVRSPTARAAAQIEAGGREMRAGEAVRFLYTLGEPGVRAWDLSEPPDPASVDRARYTELLFRAAAEALSPLGVDEGSLRRLALDRVRALPLPGMARPGQHLPLSVALNPKLNAA